MAQGVDGWKWVNKVGKVGWGVGWVDGVQSSLMRKYALNTER